MVILCRSPKGLYANYNMITFDLFTSENPLTCFMRDCDVGQNNL